MKKEILKPITDEFDLVTRYKLYRTVYEIIHPTISKKNISSYKIVVDDDIVPLRIFYPNKVSNLNSIIIYLHGGGWITGSVNSYSKVCMNIAKMTNNLVIAIDYRLAPEHKFPIPLDDCYKAIKYLYRELSKMGIDDKKITVMGDSAGGNLAVAISLMAREKKEFKIEKEILLYPALSGDYGDDSKYLSVIENSNYDLLTAKHLKNFMSLYIRDKKDLDNPLVCPLKEKNFKNLPSTLVMTGDVDPLRDEGKAYFELLKKENKRMKYVNIKFAGHGFITAKDEEIKTEVFDEINKFLKK